MYFSMIYNIQLVFWCFADVNFDEYDKSDDPHDYKFVRWLTKEKVGKENLCVLKNLMPWAMCLDCCENNFVARLCNYCWNIISGIFLFM